MGPSTARRGPAALYPRAAVGAAGTALPRKFGRSVLDAGLIDPTYIDKILRDDGEDKLLRHLHESQNWANAAA